MLDERFKQAVETGQVEDLADLYAPDARLDAALAGRDVVLVGPDAIVAELASWCPTPGRLDHWKSMPSTGGLEVIFERSNRGERMRQYHALHVVNGRISRHVVYCQQPRLGPPPPLAEPAASFLRNARHREPLAHDGDSGSQLERVVLANGRSVIVKHISAAWDWIMRATHDTGREAALWDSGVLQELPPSVDYPVLATEREGDGWAIAMGDVAAELIGSRRLSRDECRSLLHAADTIHRHFQGRPVAGLCTLADRAFMFSPAVATAERQGCDWAPKVIGRCWQHFADHVDNEVGLAVLRLVAHPTPLIAELERSGTTLIHGDFTNSNLGLDNGKVITIDWAMATAAPGDVEFVYFLRGSGRLVAASRDDLIADWRTLRGDDFDEVLFGLALLYEVVIRGWWWMQWVDSPDPADHQLQSELNWWLTRAAATLESWSPSWG